VANSGSASIVQFYFLQPGESKQVSFDLGFPELSFYNNAGQAVIEPTRYTVWIGGSSEASEHADFDIVP
jgi:beta-glucosidase